MTTSSRGGCRAFWPSVLVLLVGAPAALALPTLDRNPADYFLLANRSAVIKNLALEPPGCHVGVNCPRPTTNSSCGVLSGKRAELPPGAQLTADHLCATREFGSVFRNDGACDPTCAMIADPGSAPDCTSPFTPPILDDLDHDGNPSCSAQCAIDVDDIAAACGVTLPLPACDPTKPVLARPDDDCSVGDTLPGNHQCDLAAGTYGTLMVQNGARVELGAGTTVLCQLLGGRAIRFSSTGPATVIVPDAGRVRFNNGADVGSTCGALRVIADQGSVRFGRHGDFTLDVCALRGTFNLGHDNNLHGHFIGDRVAMDLNNDGRCCPRDTTTTTTTSTTTTTTTTTTTSTTTTTTLHGTTTTTIHGTTTTTCSKTTTTSTTTTSPSTTTTTLPKLFTRTIGFYKQHPAITAAILTKSGPLAVCGKTVANVLVNSASSALEAMCLSPQGNQRVQLARQLTAAALTQAAGGATFADFATCNAVCANPASTTAALTACIDSTDAFNQSGDPIGAPWDPPGAASSGPCSMAAQTACQLLAPASCALP